MRLPNTAHTSRPWRIHEIAGGFRMVGVDHAIGRGLADGDRLGVSGMSGGAT